MIYGVPRSSTQALALPTRGQGKTETGRQAAEFPVSVANVNHLVLFSLILLSMCPPARFCFSLRHVLFYSSKWVLKWSLRCVGYVGARTLQTKEWKEERSRKQEGDETEWGGCGLFIAVRWLM